MPKYLGIRMLMILDGKFKGVIIVGFSGEFQSHSSSERVAAIVDNMLPF